MHRHLSTGSTLLSALMAAHRCGNLVPDGEPDPAQSPTSRGGHGHRVSAVRCRGTEATFPRPGERRDQSAASTAS